MKRAFDLTAALAGLLVLSPLLVAIAVAVRLTSPGPVLFRARRVGRHGAPFHVLKFRTMVDRAHAQGPALTLPGDPRITRLGRWLRRTKLDELPQLLNVVRGEMSLVGPRPEDPRYVALYRAEHRRILDHRPGITSPASIAYAQEERKLGGDDWERRYVDHLLPAKLEMDIEYFERPSLRADLALIVRTVGAIGPRS